MGRIKKYQTEEERKQAIKEYMKQYRKKNAEYYKEYDKQWRLENAERRREYRKQYYQDNAERNKEQMKQYYQDNAERLKEYQKQYNQTPMGRASHLLCTYNQNDKKHNRGRGDLTSEWIVERIFSQPCAHCGKEGWKVIGCNRLDNSLPHTMDNVEPCCFECNCKLSGRPIKIQNDN